MGWLAAQSVVESCRSKEQTVTDDVEISISDPENIAYLQSKTNKQRCDYQALIANQFLRFIAVGRFERWVESAFDQRSKVNRITCDYLGELDGHTYRKTFEAKGTIKIAAYATHKELNDLGAQW